MNEKRGMAITYQLIIIICAVAGLIVIFMFVTGIGFGNLSQKEVCHLSVITRATAPESAQSYFPLKCNTQKICLHDGQGCDYSFAGENAEKIKLERDESKAAEQIAEASAKAMYDCWQMMGEGKLDLFHSLSQKAGFKVTGTDCIICSRIAVDTSTKTGTDFKRMDKIFRFVDLSDYLQTHQPPEREDGATYLQAFTDKSISSYAKVTSDAYQKKLEENKIPGLGCDSSACVTFKDSTYEPEVAVVFMQIKPTSYTKAFDTIAKLGATAAGASFAISPKWTMAGGKILGKAAMKFPVVTAVAAAAGVAYISLNVHEGRVAAAGYCGEVSIPGQGASKIPRDIAKNGCSMVAVLPYDANAINKMCSYYDSQP
jgi:hypothetical protein